MSLGKSVRLFLAEGTPGGLLTAEIMNWTGHVIAAPRSDLGNLVKRPETRRTGIYLLIGDDPDAPAGLRSYIGEADDVSKRLLQHAKPSEVGGKDFWERAIVLTSKDANLTKAHARYLESRLISTALAARRTALENHTAPEPLQLPEGDVSDMEYYISQAMLVLPLLGVNILRAAPVSVPAPPTSPPVGPAVDASPRFEMTSTRHGTRAVAQEIDGEFTVAKGSRTRNSWNGAPQHNYRKMFEQLVHNGTLIPSSTDQHLEFAHDQVFSSPSAAAAMVAGRSANGRIEWRVQDTKVGYGEWQEQMIHQEMNSAT